MSNIDKRALREAAEKASTDNHTQDEWFHYLCCSTPETVLALLDELEAKEEQRANWFQMAQKLGEDLDAAEKRIAELEEREVRLTDINEYLAEVHDKTLNQAFRLLAEGVRAGDVAAMRAAGINVAAAGKGEAS